MKVEVTTPEDYVGDVIGDLNSRRGQIQGTDQRGNAQVIIAMVPLANMFGYVNTLRVDDPGPRRTSTWNTTTTRRCRRRWPTKWSRSTLDNDLKSIRRPR